MIFGIAVLLGLVLLTVAILYFLGGLYLGIVPFGIGVVAFVLVPIGVQTTTATYRKAIGDVYGNLGLSALGEALLVWRGASGYTIYKLGYDAEEDTMYYKHQGEKREVFDSQSWMSYLFGRPFGVLSDGPGKSGTAEVRTPLIAEVTQVLQRMQESGVVVKSIDGVKKVTRYAKVPSSMAVIHPGKARFHGSADTTTKEQVKDYSKKSQSGYGHEMSSWKLMTLVTAFIVTFIIVLLLGPDALGSGGGEWEPPVNESVISGSVSVLIDSMGVSR